MSTNLNYPKPVNPDDGCDWTAVILWRMNAGARARSRSCFVPAPRPVLVTRITAKPESRPSRRPAAVTPSERLQKTHTATVIYSGGEKTVRIRETATVWTAGSKENYDKQTGHRVGTRGRCRLVLDSIKPIALKPDAKPSGDLSSQKLIALMKGKSLSYQAILMAVKKYHPDINITLDQIHKKVHGLMQSRFIGIERNDDLPVTHFTLRSVDPQFYVWSEKNAR